MRQEQGWKQAASLSVAGASDVADKNSAHMCGTDPEEIFRVLELNIGAGASTIGVVHSRGEFCGTSAALAAKQPLAETSEILIYAQCVLRDDRIIPRQVGCDQHADAGDFILFLVHLGEVFLYEIGW